MQDFRKLRVWQANRELAKRVYQLTAKFPRSEQFGLTSQMRRAVLSIGANIAEGTGRGTRLDTIRFLQMAFGSSVELLHHLMSALDLGFISQADFEEMERLLEPIRRMLAVLMAKLRIAE